MDVFVTIFLCGIAQTAAELALNSVLKIRARGRTWLVLLSREVFNNASRATRHMDCSWRASCCGCFMMPSLFTVDAWYVRVCGVL